MNNNILKNKESDIVIMEMFRTSPKNAFRLLFDSYHLPLCIYAVQLTDSFESAEDIVQDFFIYFWEKKSYLYINNNLRNYLYVSIRNATLAYMKRYNMRSMEDLSGIYYDILKDDYDKNDLEEQLQRIKKDIDNLSEQEKEAIRLVIMENKKYKIAADEMNISLNTLKTHLSRALKKLRKNNNLNLLLY